MHLNWCYWGMSLALQYGEGWMIINYEHSLNSLHKIYNGVYCKKKTSYIPLVYYKKTARLKCSTTKVPGFNLLQMWNRLLKKRYLDSNEDKINAYILLSDGRSCRCMAREKPNKLLASPVFLITFSVSRLKAEISVHPKKPRSSNVKVL